jgi:drug/metabolite transporter (DMT)-like permease
MKLKENQIVLAGIGFAITDALFLTTMGLFAKLLSQHFGAIEVIFCRNIVAIIPLFLWFLFSKNLNLLKTKRPLAHIIRGIIGTTGIILGTAALSMMPMAETVILFLTAPLFVVLLSYPLLREPVGLYKILAVLVGFTGVFIVHNPSFSSQELPFLGVVLGLCWGFSAASVNICLRWMGNTEKSATTVFYFMLCGLIIAGAHLPFAQMPEDGFSPEMLWIALGLGFASLGTQLAKTQSYRMGKAATIAPFAYSMIIWAMIYDYFIWNKPPQINVLIGSALIISSNLFILYRKSRAKPSGTKTDT